MDNPRLYLLIALSFVGLLLFQAWQADYGPRAPKQAAPSSAQAIKPGSEAPQANAPKVRAPADVPQAPNAEGASASADRPPAQAARLNSGQRIHVRTDVLDVELDTYGGDVRQAQLIQYPVSINDKTPIALMHDSGNGLYVAQSGFSMVKGSGPDHHATYQAAKSDYRLAEGEDSVQVDLTWSHDGIDVIKRYTFHRGSYAVDLQYLVRNQSEQPWQGAFYRQIKRSQPADTGHRMFGIHTYTGGAIYTTENHYEKIDFSDMRDKALQRASVKGGWVAMVQHYFLGAWIPPKDATDTFYSRYQDSTHYFNLGLITPVESHRARRRTRFQQQALCRSQSAKPAGSPVPGTGVDGRLRHPYLPFQAAVLAPKDPAQAGRQLGLGDRAAGGAAEAGVLQTLRNQLSLDGENARRTAAHATLKERFGDDKQKMNQALMDLYKKEKINPLGGCLPIVVQIPVFIALYWVLLESVELRQAPWILWVQDLSTKDPFYVLPVLMGLTMVVQQRLNPAPLDPLQAKIMMFLPIIFTVFFLFFPAGLVLYWVTNNSLSILQQWIITRRITGATAQALNSAAARACVRRAVEVMAYVEDTIAAVATPPGKGGIGIVRVSGPRSRDIANGLLGRIPAPRRALHTQFHDADGQAIDDGIALFFPAPRTFTGEDVLELQGHGGQVVLDLVLQACLARGARMAAPGEFSQRAFLNGRVDLTQAEAIADLIEAGSQLAARAALRSLQGSFSRRVYALLEQLIVLRTFVEAAIDFPEEEIDFLADAGIRAQAAELQAEVEVIIASARQGCLLRDGITVVIAGRPNAGKSSLLNALAGRDTAIVTDVPGTTRDVLREHIELDGMPVHIVDTAGLRDTEDQVERIGVERAWRALAEADRILLVLDDREGFTDARSGNPRGLAGPGSIDPVAQQDRPHGGRAGSGVQGPAHRCPFSPHRCRTRQSAHPSKGEHRLQQRGRRRLPCPAPAPRRTARGKAPPRASLRPPGPRCRRTRRGGTALDPTLLRPDHRRVHQRRSTWPHFRELLHRQVTAMIQLGLKFGAGGADRADNGGWADAAEAANKK